MAKKVIRGITRFTDRVRNCDHCPHMAHGRSRCNVVEDPRKPGKVCRCTG